MFNSRNRWGVTAVLIALLLSSTNSYAAVKAGSACSKAGIKSVSAGKTYTCVKRGKKLVWDKGVLIPVAKPAPSASASAAPVVVQVKEGDSCEKMGVQGKDSQGLLECRKFAGNVLKFIRISNDFSPVSNPKSPDPLSLCQLSDKRTVIPVDQKNNVPMSIAYPPTPISTFSGSTGTFKIVVVGVDFPDVPGKGTPDEIWKDDIVKASQWMNWYTNGKVKLDIKTYPKWVRAPKESSSYDASNHGARGPNDVQSGGLTAQQISDDYIHTIEQIADLSGATSIWVYLPPNISKPYGGFQPHSAGVQSKKYGFVKAQLVVNSADTYLSHRPRYAYNLHEMIHAFGLQGHSPKFIPTDGYLNRNGMMSTADGWTQALLPWDAITWGVADSTDTYCIDKSHLSSLELKLVPLEREQEGLRSAIIRINDHQALVVESHRSDKWGIGEGPGFAGTMVSIIDTTKSTTFEDSTSPGNPCITSTGVYLRVADGNHGRHQVLGKPLFNDGVRYFGATVYNGEAIAGDDDPWDLNHLMYPGESISSAGIKVTLLKGGDNDTVRIEVVDKSVTEFIQPPLTAECQAQLVPKNVNGNASTSTTTNTTNTNSSGSRANPFPVSADVSAPSDLKISTSGSSVNLSWVHSTKGSVKIEYYRVRGDCMKSGVSCGTYTNDIWSLPGSDGSPMSVQLSQSMLGNPPSGGQWKFYLGAANQTQKLSAAEMNFEPVTL
jgi:uncharacterized protein YodC (DUF2158 family)